MHEYPEMMTPEQAAEFLQCSKRTVYDRLREGTLPGVKIGHEWRLSKTVIIDMTRANLKTFYGKQHAVPPEE